MVSINNYSVIFGQRALFKNISLFISKKDKIGLVGKNGAGKSTLLKSIIGLQKGTEGEVIVPKETTLGYLPQEMEHNENATILDEASSAFSDIAVLEEKLETITQSLGEREDYQSESYIKLIEELNEINDRLTVLGSGNKEQMVERVLKGLGFSSSDMDRQMSEFSGGWKMRVELAKILLVQPDLILLDEPTNHLDIDSIEWLESFLSTYPGAIVMISHDRNFLDAITTRTVEIANGRVYDYKFAYSKYLAQREQELETQIEAAKAQQKYIKDTEVLINKFRAKKNKAAFAQSLIKKLDKLERIDIDQLDNSAMNFTFPPAPRSGKAVVTAENVAKNYEELQVFEHVDLVLGRQEKIALVGKNGAGKTTLTKILNGQLDYDGKLLIGHNVEVGYYSQDQAESLDMEKTVFETIDDVAEGEIRTQLRALLGAFLFQGEDIDKKVKVLSGGEKARLALCKLMLKPYNLLIMDEPTNHLDMRSKDMLKNALKTYDGTVIIVSHDRHFLHQLVEVIYEVTPKGLKQHLGDIYDFLKKKKTESIAHFEHAKSQNKKEEKASSSNKEDYETRKENERRKRKLTNLISKCQAQIDEKEKKLKELDSVIAELDYSDQKAANKILDEYAEIKNAVGDLMGQWEEAEMELEELTANS
ncbi:MAG: ABC-F family ATP-binding cassette domain-containing protein [Flavobacteriales bacterium]